MKLKFFRTSQYSALNEATELGGTRVIQLENNIPPNFTEGKVAELVKHLTEAINMMDETEEVLFFLTNDDDEVIATHNKETDMHYYLIDPAGRFLCEGGKLSYVQYDAIKFDSKVSHPGFSCITI